MQTHFQFSRSSKLVFISIACALFLAACGGGGGGGTTNDNSNVTGVSTPSKVSIVNTNQ